MADIAIKVLSIFLIMAVGFVANRMGILPKEANKYMTNLLILILSPCLIVSSITTKELTDDTLANTLMVIGGGMCFFILVVPLSALLCKLVLRGEEKKDLSTYVYAFGSVNSGFMGFPLSLSLFGKDIFYLMVMHNVTLMLYIYSIGPMVLGMGSSEKGKVSIKALLKSLNNPNTLAAAVSFVMLFLGLRLPDFLESSVTTIGNATIPLSMILVGMQLGESNIFRIVKNKSLVIISFMKLLALPFITFLAVNWLPIPVEVKLCLIFVSVFPAAVAIVPVAAIENKNALLSAEFIAFTTFVSIFSIPIFSTLLTWYYRL